MKIINVFLIALCLAILASCHSQSSLGDVDLKQFFWNLDSFTNPKVIVYDINTYGTHSKNYFLVERTRSNELTLTKYNDEFEPVQKLVDRFDSTGCTLIDAQIIHYVGDSMVFTPVQLLNGNIFNYRHASDSLSTKTVFNPPDNHQTTIVLHSKWLLDSIRDEKMNGEILPTIVAHGTRRTIIYNPDTTLVDDKIELWYTKGLGLTRYYFSDSNGHFVEERYEKIISPEEFDTLKNNEN